MPARLLLYVEIDNSKSRVPDMPSRFPVMSTSLTFDFKSMLAARQTAL